MSKTPDKQAERCRLAYQLRAAHNGSNLVLIFNAALNATYDAGYPHLSLNRALDVLLILDEMADAHQQASGAQ